VPLPSAARADRPSRRAVAPLAWTATLLLILLVLALAPSGAWAAAASTSPTHTLITRVSNLRDSTSWAYPTGEAAIRSSPSPHSHTVSRLKLLTIDDQAELYVVLASAKLASGGTWLQVEVPARPNGRTGWVPRAALGTLHVVKSYLLVDQQTLTATLFKEGKSIFSARVGVGKASTVTPAGNFYVLEKLRAVNAPVYGPYALGTSAYAPTLSEWPGGGVVGIHGTNEPQLIPGRPSHGCVRMHDADIARLWHLIELGTPIRIT
jgi:L,D-transpeptidase catalytic domain